jgi:hypothetical protein
VYVADYGTGLVVNDTLNEKIFLTTPYFLHPTRKARVSTLMMGGRLLRNNEEAAVAMEQRGQLIRLFCRRPTNFRRSQQQNNKPLNRL